MTSWEIFVGDSRRSFGWAFSVGTISTIAEISIQCGAMFYVWESLRQPKPNIGNSYPLGSQYVFSGSDPTGPVEMPDIGSVASSKLETKSRHLPAYI